MEIIHEAFDFNRQLKDIDDVLSVSGDKVKKFCGSAPHPGVLNGIDS